MTVSQRNVSSVVASHYVSLPKWKPGGQSCNFQYSHFVSWLKPWKVTSCLTWTLCRICMSLEKKLSGSFLCHIVNRAIHYNPPPCMQLVYSQRSLCHMKEGTGILYYSTILVMFNFSLEQRESCTFLSCFQKT